MPMRFVRSAHARAIARYFGSDGISMPWGVPADDAVEVLRHGRILLSLLDARIAEARDFYLTKGQRPKACGQADSSLSTEDH